MTLDVLFDHHRGASSHSNSIVCFTLVKLKQQNTSLVKKNKQFVPTTRQMTPEVELKGESDIYGSLLECVTLF